MRWTNCPAAAAAAASSGRSPQKQKPTLQLQVVAPGAGGGGGGGVALFSENHDPIKPQLVLPFELIAEVAVKPASRSSRIHIRLDLCP